MSTRRKLVGGTVAAIGLLLPGRAVTAGPGDGLEAGCPYGTGAQLLTRYVDEVLNDRLVETFDSIIHREIAYQYPGGSAVGIDEVKRLRIEENTRREQLGMVDEWLIQAARGDNELGLASVIYTEVIDGEADTWKVAYIARIGDGLIRELDVLVGETGES